MSQSTVVIASPSRRQTFPSQSADGGEVLLDSSGTKAELGGSLKSFTWTITGVGSDNQDFKRTVDGPNATVLLPAGVYSVSLLVTSSTDTNSDSVPRFTVEPFVAPSPSPAPIPKAAAGVIAVDLTKPPGPPPSSPSPPPPVPPPDQPPPTGVTPPTAGDTTPSPPPSVTPPPSTTLPPASPPSTGGTPVPVNPIPPPGDTTPTPTPTPSPPTAGDASGGAAAGGVAPPPTTTPPPADNTGDTGESGTTPTPPPTPTPTPTPEPTPTPPPPTPTPTPTPVTPPPTPVTPPPTPVPPPPVVPPPTPVTPPPAPVTPPPTPVTPPPAQPPPAADPPASYERQCFIQDYNMADQDEWDAMKQCCDEAKADPKAVEPDCNNLPARPAGGAPAAPPPPAAAAPPPPPPATTPTPPPPATPAPTPDKEPEYECVKADYDMTDPDSWEGFDQCCKDAKSDGYDINKYFPDCNSVPAKPPPRND